MQLEAGQRIKHYTLEQRLGSGASGDVWRAHDGKRMVAIKFMNEQLVNSDAADHYRAQLEMEVNALGRLHHAHIPALYDHDLTFARPYLVMQYVEGLPYDRLISGGEIFGLDLRQRLMVLEAIAGAIEAAHAAGIIHRDIKPAHISGIDQPFLLDFSVALEHDHIHEARPNVGTVLYMPPPDEPPDELSDNYSFALTAYEMIFGRHALFTIGDVGLTATAMRELAAERVQHGTWRLPSALPRPELPGDLFGAELEGLDTIFAAALGERAGRYPQAGAFVDDLKSAILTPSNQPYLDNPLRLAYLPTFAAPPIPAEEAYTLNEVARSFRDTDHGYKRRRKPRSWKSWLRLGK